MIVVSDTTPLNHLILVGAADVLPALFGRVYAPKAVMRELADPRGPQRVRDWANSVTIAVRLPPTARPIPVAR